jgi:hypothetical protein
VTLSKSVSSASSFCCTGSPRGVRDRLERPELRLLFSAKLGLRFPSLAGWADPVEGAIPTLGGAVVRIILVYLLARRAHVMSRFRGLGASERSKHVRTIILLLA